MIYLNAASHGLPSAATLARIQTHLALEARIGPLAALETVAEDLARLDRDLSRLIGARAADLFLGFTTTASYMDVALRLVRPGARVLVAPQDWGDHLAILHRLGAEVVPLPPLEAGDHDAQGWQAQITEEVAMISVPLISSISGARLPVAALGQAPRPDGCALVVDAAQGLGQGPIDGTALGADVLLGTCRKWLRGPRGVALIWRAPRMAQTLPVAEMRPNDGNIALWLGLGVALTEALDPKVPAALAARRDRLWQGALAQGWRSWSGGAPDSGAVTLAVPHARADAVQAAFKAHGIVAKWPDPGRDEPLAPAGPPGTRPLRLSAHLDVREDDLDRVLGALGSAV